MPVIRPRPAFSRKCVSLNSFFAPSRSSARGSEVINNSTSFHPLGLIPSAMDSPKVPRLFNVEGSRFGRAAQKLQLFPYNTLGAGGAKGIIRKPSIQETKLFSIIDQEKFDK